VPVKGDLGSRLVQPSSPPFEHSVPQPLLVNAVFEGDRNTGLLSRSRAGARRPHDRLCTLGRPSRASRPGLGRLRSKPGGKARDPIDLNRHKGL